MSCIPLPRSGHRPRLPTSFVRIPCSPSFLSEAHLGSQTKPAPREGEGGEQENTPAAFQMTGLASWCEHLSTGLLMGVGP